MTPCRGDDGPGAAQVRADRQHRRGHVTRAALRQQPAHGTPAREGSGAQHQKEQVQTEQERRAFTCVTDRCVRKTAQNDRNANEKLV